MHLGHVHINVLHVPQSVAFYSLLGLRTLQLTAQSALLSFGGQHHDMALRAIDPMYTHSRLGMHNSAFEAEDVRQLAEVYQRLQQQGIAVQLEDHGDIWSMYCTDPDGNGVEIYAYPPAVPPAALSYHQPYQALPYCTQVI